MPTQWTTVLRIEEKWKGGGSHKRNVEDREDLTTYNVWSVARGPTYETGKILEEVRICILLLRL
jgi:hypothetical protein